LYVVAHHFLPKVNELDVHVKNLSPSYRNGNTQHLLSVVLTVQSEENGENGDLER